MNEAEFARSLLARLKKSGFVVTRIESHGTGNGIPDMFVQGHGNDFWLELKYDKQLKPDRLHIKVQWRPGQVAWMYEYFLAHSQVKCCLTVVGCPDGCYIIRMSKPFENKEAYFPEFVPKEYAKHLPIIFYILSQNMDLSDCKTFRDAVIKFCDVYFPSKDYDPEVLWDETIDQELDTEIFYNKQIGLYLDMTG